MSFFILLYWNGVDLQCCVSLHCAMKLRHLLLGRKVMTKLDSILKSRGITLPTKACLVKAMFFSNSHVLMSELDYKEG